MLKNFVLMSAAVFLTAYILPGVTIGQNDIVTLVVTALLLGVLSVTVKPLLTILTLPINVITLGLFSLVINAVIVLLVDYLVDGFEVDGFLWAIVFGLVLSIINSALNLLFDN